MNPLSAKVVMEDDRLQVHFEYSAVAIESIHEVPGATFVGRDRGGPYWRVPLSLTSLRRLRQEFGDTNLRQPKQLLDWERREQRRERRLGKLSRSRKDRLTLLPKLAPDLYEMLRDRPYQLGDVKHMASANLINANDVGLGKTIETIAAIYEAGLINGPHLITAPKTLLETPWVEEIENLTGLPVLWASGDNTPRHRQQVAADALHLWQRQHPFFFVTNPAQLNAGLAPDVRWNTATIDEFHDMGLSNPNTWGAQAVYKLQARRRWANSGTPLGGQPIRLWGALHYTYPRRFPSLWRWAREWLVVTNNGFGHEIKNIIPGMEQEFDQAHAPYMVRHTTQEVRPHLPKVREIQVWCRMAPTQRRQYDQLAADAELRLDGRRVSSTGILDEYSLLKIIAGAVCTADDAGRLWPTPNSCKLPQLVQRLKEAGIDRGSGHQAIVASQFSRMADLYADQLTRLGFSVTKITGDVKGSDRTKAKNDFQAGRAAVIVLSTKAGGLGLTLDRADSVHMMDETWDPDDQHQVVGRTRYKRAVMAYYYRTRDSVEEYVEQVNINKRAVNVAILDLRRLGLRAIR